MLDQNTDRMWYVIGAVIIGAAIILIMNNTFPQLFASIGETFKDKTVDVGKVVDELTPNNGGGEMTDGVQPVQREPVAITSDNLKLINATKVNYVADTDTWTLDIKPLPNVAAWWSSGLAFIPGEVVVPYGSTLTISYEIYIPEGVEGVFSNNDVNSKPVDSTVDAWAGNDNDELPLRRHNGLIARPDGSLPIDLVVGWNSASFSSTNLNVKNTQKVGIYDFSSFGVYNPTSETIRVQIRNVRGELTK